MHYFEDALSYYQNSGASIHSGHIDLFLTAVDIIKEVMQIEIDESDQLPKNYQATLQQIKNITDRKEAAAQLYDQLIAEFDKLK